jgi:hypothetical protein
MDSESFEFELPDFSEITADGDRMLLEKTVRHNGIWRIHNNDVDPFPSDPHADRVDQPEKLDLYTGDVYSKKTKELLRTMPKKAMKYIYQQIMDADMEMVCKKLEANKDSIEYL